MRSTNRGRRRLTMVAASVALMVAAAGCSGGTTENKSAESSEPQRGGVVTIDWVANPVSLDPLKFNSFANFNIYSLVYSTLYRWQEDGSLEPELASGPAKISEDGLRYEIPIREGAHWHDGTALTAKDVAFTINTVRDPKHASTWYGALASLEKAEAPDDRTVVLTLSSPYSPLEGMLAQIPVISSAKKYESNKTWANTMLGTGPFKFDRWDQGSQVVLKRNGDYFKKDLPHLDGVVMRTVPEEAARIANVASGNSHIVPMVPYNQIDTLKKRGVEVVTTEKSAIMPLIFPSLQKGRPSADPDFRKAVAWAIDRKQIIDQVYQGTAEPASTVMATGTPHWDEKLGTAYGDKPNLDKARAALKKYGDVNREITLTVRNQPQSIAVATIIQSNLKEIGLKVKLSPEEAASYFPKLTSGDFDLMVLDIEVGLTSGFTPNYVYAALHTGAPTNFTGFSDKELDKRLAAAVSNPENPAEAWRAVQERDLEVVPLIPTVTMRYVEAYSPKLQGYTPSSLLSLRGLDEAHLAQ